MGTTTASTIATEHAARDRLAQSLQEMVDEAEHLLKTAQRSGREEFIAARDKLVAQLHDARTELEALHDTAAYNVRHAARATDSAMHQHPCATADLAAGVGVLVGRLISRR